MNKAQQLLRLIETLEASKVAKGKSYIVTGPGFVFDEGEEIECTYARRYGSKIDFAFQVGGDNRVLTAKSNEDLPLEEI